MRTQLSELAQATSGATAAERIIKTCIHCGCCNSACPTFDLLGDEADSPRGRIYLMKEMLEQGKPPTRDAVLHLDRCLSCLNCLTTCPSGVDYMHLIDHARVHIDRNYRRPLIDRLIRRIIARTLPYPQRFRSALRLAAAFRWTAPVIAAVPRLKPLSAMLKMAPGRVPSKAVNPAPAIYPANTERRMRVIVPSGCAQQVLEPGINRAAIELLNRIGVEVVVTASEGCCGALVHHMGHREQALLQARTNIDAWHKELTESGLDAIVITASGCGTTIKDYGHIFADDPAYADKAATVSGRARDITEFLIGFGLPAPEQKSGLRVAYHPPCSLQHGQKIINEPRKLLLKAGFKVARAQKEHLCCGSAGAYNILQSEIADQLRDNRVAALEETKADLIATGNIGCLKQIASTSRLPVVHTVELLNWALGGRKPSIIDQ